MHNACPLFLWVEDPQQRFWRWHPMLGRLTTGAPHLGDVDAQTAVDAGALDAQEDAQVERGPVRVGRAAVGAPPIALDPPQRVNDSAAGALPGWRGPAAPQLRRPGHSRQPGVHRLQASPHVSQQVSVAQGERTTSVFVSPLLLLCQASLSNVMILRRDGNKSQALIELMAIVLERGAM